MTPENNNILETIASLRRLRTELQQQYNELVLPWGTGYGMPDDVSAKATEVAEHVSAVQQKIDEFEKQLGIDSRHEIPAPNARAISSAEVYWRTEAKFEELVGAVAARMCWSYEDLNSYMSHAGADWLDQYAPRAQHLMKETAFWEFIASRCRTVLAKLISEVKDEVDEPAFRRVVRQELRFYLFSEDTFKAFEYKFMSY